MQVLFILTTEWWSLALLPVITVLAGAFAFSDPKETSVKWWAEPFSACCSRQLLAVSLPHLTVFISCLSPAVSYVNREAGSEQVRAPACQETPVPASPSPASLLTCSSAQIFQQLRYSKLLETTKRTQNLRQKDRASSLCQITMCHVMLGKWSWLFFL